MLAFSDDTLDASAKSTRKINQFFDKNADIPASSEYSGMAYQLLSGFACRYQLLPSGRRQITALVVPGDVFDCDGFERSSAGSGFSALVRCEVLQHSLPAERRYHYLRQREAVACQWLVSLGQRSALQRLAHLLCEFNVRLSRVRLSTTNSFVFPVCQTDIADILGLSTVHVNRSWQSLRAAGLISFVRRRLTILDIAALQKLAVFDPNYLSADDTTLPGWSAHSLAG